MDKINRREFLETIGAATFLYLTGCTTSNEPQRDATSPQATPDSKVIAEIRPEDFVMSKEEAVRYMIQDIQPKIDRILKDSRTPEGIKSRIRALYDRINAGEILYRLSADPLPNGGCYGARMAT